MTWTERENIFAREIITISDIQQLFEIKNRTAAAEFLRSIKRKLRIDGVDLIVDLPGKIHRIDYLKWVGIDNTSQYGAAEKARKYVADVFEFNSAKREVSTYNPFLNEGRII